ncbi:hypothetical protein TGAM01_v207221 [Trichoderma gamsii]|uniref:Uncharacterized protein n=1 Tax=Trichoderma gamsii TaxID=398673 RepID=A0A2P4ZHZ1_9HYPO|nr:hypothetical protein TGAM01_v207221 [Trichoderma gamsii]PON23893.1 hypothetical protein TGAM01_v207221 [Trichoderma gamsii]
MTSLSLPPPALFQLTPFFLLILLYGVCPQHFPPSAATTSFFILYAIAIQLAIHRASTVSVLHNLSIIFLSAAHLAVAAIYTLYYTAQAVMRARNALFAYFERVHRQIHQLANVTRLRFLRVPAPTCLTLSLDMFCDDESTFSETTSVYSSKNNTVYTSQWRYRELSSSNFVPPSFEMRGYLPYQPYPIVWFFRHLFYFTRAVVSCVCSTLLSIFFTVKLFHDTTVSSICFTRACFTFINKYIVKPYFPTPWYLAKFSMQQFPTFTLFAMHLTITIIVLSLGETNALGLCILLEFWLLSRLERL